MTEQREVTMVFSDTSATGGGAWVRTGAGTEFSVTRWSEEEKNKSSTWRELEAVAKTLPSLGRFLGGKQVKWNSDNTGVVSI